MIERCGCSSACSSTLSIRSPSPCESTSRLELEPELCVADLDPVEVLELYRRVELGPVQERPVGRVHVLNVVAAAARVDAGVDLRREAVLDPYVGVARPAQRAPTEEVEAPPRVGPPPLRHHEPGARPPAPAAVVDGIEAGRLGSGA